MDSLCYQLSKINITSEILLNINTFQLDQIDFRGIYKEFITSQKIYKMYSCGVYVVGKNNDIKINHLELIEQDGNIIVITS